jgi:hypothetical protein
MCNIQTVTGLLLGDAVGEKLGDTEGDSVGLRLGAVLVPIVSANDGLCDGFA